jgi:hypothetical protein
MLSVPPEPSAVFVVAACGDAERQRGDETARGCHGE